MTQTNKKLKLTKGHKIERELRESTIHFTNDEIEKVNFHYYKETDNYWHFAIRKVNFPPKLYQALKNPYKITKIKKEGRDLIWMKII